MMPSTFPNEQQAHLSFQLSLLQLATIPGPSGVANEAVREEARRLEQYVDTMVIAARR